MTRRALLTITIAAPALLAAGTWLSNLGFSNGSRVWVEGTSTTRSWRCEATQLEGSAATSAVDVAQLGSVPRAEVSFAVSNLDCRNGTMNGHMRNALQAQEHPTIRFAATSVTVTPSASGPAAVRMAGNLTIAGTTRPATVTGTAVTENGALRVRGTHAFDMTEFGVRPPSLMAGTMRVRPAVTVGFDVLMRP